MLNQQRETTERLVPIEQEKVLDVDTKCREGSGSGRKPERAMAVLGPGRSVVVIGHDLDLGSFLKSLQETASKARRAQSYGLRLPEFLRMLRDMSRG